MKSKVYQSFSDFWSFPDKALKFGAYHFQLKLADVGTLLQAMVQLFRILCFVWFGTSMFNWPAQMSLLDSWLQSNHNFPDSSCVDWAEWFEYDFIIAFANIWDHLLVDTIYSVDEFVSFSNRKINDLLSFMERMDRLLLVRVINSCWCRN